MFQKGSCLLLLSFHLPFPKLQFTLKGITHFFRFSGMPVILTLGMCFIVWCLRNCRKMLNNFKMYKKINALKKYIYLINVM